MQKAVFFILLWLPPIGASAQKTAPDASGKIPASSSRIKYDVLLKERMQELEEMKEAGIEMEQVGEGPEFQLERWKWKMEQQVDGQGYVVPFSQITGEWEKYLSKHQAAAKSTTVSNWLLEGPKTSSSGYGNLGRVNIVAFDPINANTLYAGTPGGSLWKTTDGGNTWTPLYANMPSMGITDIKINPIYHNIIYVVTGDADGYSTSSMGVIVSRDGGATWYNTALSWGPGVNTATSLLINPLDTNKMMLGTYNGLYRTNNAGLSWTLLNNLHYRQLLYNPSDTSIVYGTTYLISPAQRAQILRSGNGGTTWDSVTTFTNSTRIALAVTPAAPRMVKALVYGDLGYNGLYDSHDHGLTYSPVDTGNSSCTHNLLGWDTIVSCMSQGTYDLCIAVHPTDSNEVAIGGVTTFLSSDGGVSWQIANEWGHVPTAPHVHPDKHFLGYNKLTGALFEGSDGGLHKSTNPLTYWQDLTNGMSITEFYHCATDNGVTFCLGGSQDNGTMKLNSGSVSIIKGYDGFQTLINYGDPANVFYATDQFGAYITRDGGATWRSMTDTFHVPWQNWWTTRKYFALHPQDTATLLMAQGPLIYKSTNNGISWAPLAPLMDTSAAGGTIRLFTISPKNPNYIYATRYFGASNLHYSTDFGATWDMTSLPSAPNYVTDLQAEPGNENNVWVALFSFAAGNVLWSYDKATDLWTNESGSLPAMPVNCITFDSSSGTVYVGTRTAVFYRTTAMSDWALYSNSLPAANIKELTINYTTGEIWAATYGRGMWHSLKNDLPSGVSTVRSRNLSIHPNPATNMVTIALADLDNNATVMLADITGRVLVGKTVQSGDKSCVLDVSNIANGFYFVTVKTGLKQYTGKLIKQ